MPKWSLPLLMSIKFCGKTIAYCFSAIGFLVFFKIALSFLAWFDFAEQKAVDSRNVDAFVNRADEFWAAASRVSGIEGHLQIRQGSKVLLSKGYRADEHRRLPDGSTRYFIASVSKQFTAAQIYRLAEMGKLDFDDSVCRYVEHFCQGKLASIKIKHLLTNSSGLSGFPLSLSGAVGMYKDMFVAVDLADIVKRQSPGFFDSEPGAEFSYSNFGFEVLAAVAEQASGESYHRFTKKFFEGFDLHSTFVQSPESSRPPGVIGHSLVSFPWNEKAIPVPRVWSFLKYGNSYGAGAVVSTTDDLSLWAQKLMRGEVFSREMRDRLWTPHLEEYASGWVIIANKVTKKNVVWHNGRIPGFFSALALYPEQNLSVAWLSDSAVSSSSEKQVVKGFDNLLFGKDYLQPSKRFRIPSLRF